MSEFMDGHAVNTQKAMLRREEGPSSSVCQSCKRNQGTQPLYRCVDCFGRRVCCAGCEVKIHRYNPFHRMEKWTADASFWKRITLAELGFVMQLGHEDDDWNTCDRATAPREMTVVHSRGVEKMKMRFCHCIASGKMVPKSDTEQLLDRDLFPGSWKHPQSVYAMQTLKDYHLLALQSQLTAGDYMKFLARSTDNVAPDRVAVRLFTFS